MELTKEQSKLQNIMHTVIGKAWEDESFKQTLINSPVETIEKATGEKLVLEKGVQLVVKDQTDPSTVYLNIPRKVELDNLELTDEQLELVAGGEIAVGLAVVGVFAAGIGIGIALKHA